MSIDQEFLCKFVGERLKRKRSRVPMTQLELANKVNLSRASIANIEAGQQNAPLNVLYEICLVLKLEPADLFPTLEQIQCSSSEVAAHIAQAMTGEGKTLAAQALNRYSRSIQGEINVDNAQLGNQSREASDPDMGPSQISHTG